MPLLLWGFSPGHLILLMAYVPKKVGGTKIFLGGNALQGVEQKMLLGCKGATWGDMVVSNN